MNSIKKKEKKIKSQKLKWNVDFIIFILGKTNQKKKKKKIISMRDSGEYVKNIIFQDRQSLVTKLVIVQGCNFIQ